MLRCLAERRFGRADLDEHALDLRQRGKGLLEGLLHLHGLGQSRAGNAHRLDDAVAFREVANELLGSKIIPKLGCAENAA